MSVFHTQFKGELAVAKIQVRALEKGFTLSKPFVEARYDLILDDRSKLQRVQVKYGGGKDRNGAVFTHLEKVNRNNKLHYSKEEVDLLLIYYPVKDIILAFGPAQFHDKTGIMVRFEEAKVKNPTVNWYNDFVW